MIFDNRGMISLTRPMRVLGWDIHLRKRRCAPISSFPNALARVRSLRERCQWPPLSNQPAIRQREERVTAFRKRVLYEPVKPDTTPRPGRAYHPVSVVESGRAERKLRWLTA